MKINQNNLNNINNVNNTNNQSLLKSPEALSQPTSYTSDALSFRIPMAAPINNPIGPFNNPKQGFITGLVNNNSTYGQSLPNTGYNIAQNAKNIVGSRFRSADLDYGRLACAYAASTALRNAGLLDKKVASCDALKQVLTNAGFSSSNLNSKNFQPSIYMPGDVVFFAKNSSGHGHVGIISRVDRSSTGAISVYMVHNSTPDREVKEIKLNDYSRFPNSIYRKA